MAKLVSRMHGVHEAVGSSPTSPTKRDFRKYREFCFFRTKRGEEFFWPTYQ